MAVLMGATIVGLINLHGLSAQAGPAIGQFEMKDLEAEPGEIEFQSQNAWSFGQPRRRMAEPEAGEVVYDDNSVTRQRHALEIEMTMNRFMRMRVGIEYEKERFDGPATPGLANAFDDLKLSEVALEGVLILMPVPESGGVGFGLLSEFEHPIASPDLNTILFGPIIEAKAGPWSALLNVMFIKHFGAGQRTDEGLERDTKWDLGYAAQLRYEFNSSWAMALEAYGTVDRISNSGRRDEAAQLFGDHDQHRAGPIVYHEWRVSGGSDRTARGGDRGSRHVAGVAARDDDDKPGKDGDAKDGVLLRLGTGVLFGLNDNTPDTTLKLSFEAEF